jgi:hypothetical protein
MLQESGKAPLLSSMTVDRILAPNAKMQERVEDIFGLAQGALSTGYLIVETDDDVSGVIGFLECGPVDGAVSAVIQAQDRGYSEFSFLKPIAPPKGLHWPCVSQFQQRTGSSPRGNDG